jgi:hypothetical protein
MEGSHLDDPLTGDFPGERVFAAGIQTRYVLHDPAEGAPALVVAFSAAHEPGTPPRYYTHKALRGLGCPRLFVLDDQGPLLPLARPCWYLGRRETGFEVAEAVLELMGRTAEELGVPRRRVITCGASKGGWAALYFGARFGAGHAIAGEPQAYLGRYLCTEEHAAIAGHIAGDASEASSEFLDGLLFAALRESASPPRVHLFCGRTPYYEREILPLAAFLEDTGIEHEIEVGDFTEHVPDLGLNYPPFLRSRIETLMRRMGAPA